VEINPPLKMTDIFYHRGLNAFIAVNEVTTEEGEEEEDDEGKTSYVRVLKYAETRRRFDQVGRFTRTDEFEYVGEYKHLIITDCEFVDGKKNLKCSLVNKNGDEVDSILIVNIQYIMQRSEIYHMCVLDKMFIVHFESSNGRGYVHAVQMTKKRTKRSSKKRHRRRKKKKGHRHRTDHRFHRGARSNSIAKRVTKMECSPDGGIYVFHKIDGDPHISVFRFIDKYGKKKVISAETTRRLPDESVTDIIYDVIKHRAFFIFCGRKFVEIDKENEDEDDGHKLIVNEVEGKHRFLFDNNGRLFQFTKGPPRLAQDDDGEWSISIKK
jgi:hypothetical protein